MLEFSSTVLLAPSPYRGQFRQLTIISEHSTNGLC